MKTSIKLLLGFCLMMFFISGYVSATDIVSAKSGKWSDPTTWSPAQVPTATDNVTISTNHRDTIDITNAVCNNLTINSIGRLYFRNDGSPSGITINGNVTVNGEFKCNNLFPTNSSFITHYMTIYGNLSNTNIFDMRTGSSGSTANGCDVTFAGSTDSYVSLSQTAYASSTEEFNSVTINKTGNAKLILASGNAFMSNNMTVGPCILTLQKGILETGTNIWVHLSSASGGVVGGSDSSYVIGTLGRGMATSAGTSRVFQVGDANGYRPITVRSKTGIASGGYIAVSVNYGNSNTGSSTLVGDIDKVSMVRYSKVTFYQGTSSTTTVDIDRFIPSYGTDDGVSPNNTNLRVAYSTDSRNTWNDLGPIDHSTSLDNPPTPITSDSLATPYTLETSLSMFVTLARKAGTTDNSLEPLILLGSISGKKYADIESDSSITGNYGLGNCIIKLFKDGLLSKRVVTSSDGSYSFNGLIAGTYTVEESLKIGWLQTYPRVGSPNVTLTTYGINAGPRAYNIVISGGNDVANIDFGNYEYPSISGYKYLDVEGDSLITGDIPLQDWIIKLYKDGILQSRVATEINGSFIFNNLLPGNYTIEESLKTNWVQTFPRVSSPGVVLTTFGANAGPRAYYVSITTSGNIIGIDFGNKPTGGGVLKVSAGVKGDWNSASTWIGGEVPLPYDDVLISNGDSVYYNQVNGAINNITVGQNTDLSTILAFKNDNNYKLTVYGNINVSGDSARFICQSEAAAPRNHTLHLKGDLISTGVVDFKTGTSPNNSLVTLILEGTENSVLSVKPFEVEPAVINEFHAITVNKTGGAKVILNSDIGMSNISSAILTLTSGKIETGPNVMGVYSTSSSSIVGGSATSYIYGKLARGWASSGVVNNKIFPVGDSSKYRPVWVSNENSNYHLLTLEILNGDANTGTSILSGEIDKVSKIRYYKATAGLIPRVGTTPSPFYLTRTGIGYYEDDGVSAGNTNLRVALSYDHRQNWTAQGPTNHTTAVGSTPTQILCDAFSQSVQLDSVFYFALARLTGTTDNPLEPKICKDIPIVAGWNLVSVPVAADNMLKTVLFPTSTSAAYAYSNGYISADTLKNGKGYWIKYGSPQNVTVCGAKILNNTVSVSAGWNLVGVYDVNVPVGSITTTPSGIISSNFFYYNAGYFTASTLTPGTGYWIKVSANGVLNLPTGSVLKQGAETNNIINSTWGKIIIEDNSGNIVSLYVSKEVENFDMYELPPAPPSEIFDARYSTNRLVENLLSGKEIFVNSDNYPIKLRVENVELNIKDILDGEKINTLLQSGEELVIEDKNINKFFVKTSEKPVEFELLPNSPNPFNPSTTIRYSIPVQSKVTLKIYSVYGQEIITLVDEIQDVNSYSLIWDGKNQAGSQVASGVYYYRIFAEPISTSGKAFTKVNKMILMK